jgi:hypothetical protein
MRFAPLRDGLGIEIEAPGFLRLSISRQTVVVLVVLWNYYFKL